MSRVAEFPDYADRRQPRRGTSLVGHQTGPRPVDRALDAVLSSLGAFYRSPRYSPSSPSLSGIETV